MQCTKCSKVGDKKDFTNTNLSKDGKRSLCKLCKKQSDASSHAKLKKHHAEMNYFELEPDLLIKGGEQCQCPKCGYHWQK